MTTSSITTTVRQGLRSLGFTDNLIHANYEFADILGNYSVKTIPLAAFLQDPPSYHSACFGVVQANGTSGAPLILSNRSLGASHFFEVFPTGIKHWRVPKTGEPTPIGGEIPAQRILKFFADHKSDWNPQSIYKERFATAKRSPTQLGLFDSGLLPLLDFEVRTKLDKLLSNLLVEAIAGRRKGREPQEEEYQRIIRLIFRLLTAKVLADRKYPGDWLDPRVPNVIRGVEELYFKHKQINLAPADEALAKSLWSMVRESFHFQNLSVDSLAYVYENTLVSDPLRKTLSIHSTPPEVAEYVVRNLPIETLDEEKRTIFEPFAGCASFLIAGMRRLRELLPNNISPQARHKYFIEHLSGIEIDEFALEVAFLSLMVADYPNPNGWNLHNGDVFSDSKFRQELKKAEIVLCNPPFEDFAAKERDKYSTPPNIHKPVAILQKVLERKPSQIGFVLPRIFMSGRGYSEIRNALADSYSTVELTGLPDSVFKHSEMETVVLLAHGTKPSKVLRLKVGEVYEAQLEQFLTDHQLSVQHEIDVQKAPNLFTKQIWLPSLKSVWDELSANPRMQSHADIHRGIEYNIPIEGNEETLFSRQAKPSFAAGLHEVENTFEPFIVGETQWLNVSPKLMRGNAYKLPWASPKVIANMARRSRGKWKLSAAIDADGLVCYQNLYGIWPMHGEPLQFLAAILNSPIANAFIAERESHRYIRKETLEDLPMPTASNSQIVQIVSLVDEYTNARTDWLHGKITPNEAKVRCYSALQEIDAAILRAYDLSPRAEKQLLDYFYGERRVTPFEFTHYYPQGFKPFISWTQFISKNLANSTAKSIIERIEPIDDPVISEALTELDRN